MTLTHRGPGDVRQPPGVPGLRRLAALLLTVLVAVAGLLPAAASASATTYRYWSYWHLTEGSWTFASTGPGGYRPADGAVEGWRFAVSGSGASAAPRVRPSFAQVCGSTPAKDGTKRVAVVIDDGVQAAAHPGDTVPGRSPRGVCAQVPETASGARVLSAVAVVRTDDGGLVCALDGYPSAGCGEVVAASNPSPSRPPASNPPGSSPRPTSRATAGTGTGTSTAATGVRAPGSSTPPGAPSTSNASRTAAATPSATRSSTASATASPSTSGSALAVASADPSPSPTLVLGRTQPASRSGGLPVGFVVGLVLVGILGAAAVLRARRGRGDAA